MIKQRGAPKHSPEPTEAERYYEERLHENRVATRGGTRLPSVPPVIETFYPSTGPPPDVVAEWSGECLRPSTTDDGGLHLLQLTQSKRRRNSVAAFVAYALGRFRLRH